MRPDALDGPVLEVKSENAGTGLFCRDGGVSPTGECRGSLSACARAREMNGRRERLGTRRRWNFGGGIRFCRDHERLSPVTNARSGIDAVAFATLRHALPAGSEATCAVITGDRALQFVLQGINLVGGPDAIVVLVWIPGDVRAAERRRLD
jgi:hypothetical protein